MPSPLFHTGGSLTAKGRLSSKPYKDKIFSRLARLEKLARLDLGFQSTGAIVPDADIARMIGRSPLSIKGMRKSVDYLRFRTEIQSGVSLQSEQSAKDIVAYRRAHFKEMLPDAMRAIAEELSRPAITVADRRLKMDIVKDFMDREGSYPKISRTDNHLKIEHDFAAADAMAEDLLKVMDEPMQAAEINNTTQRILDANSAFSNSETLTHDKQEEALATLEIMTLPTIGVH